MFILRKRELARAAMRVTPLAAVAFVVAAWSPQAGAQSRGPVQTDVPLTCYPAAALDAYLAQQGFTTKLIGAFDDGDLLVVYRDGTGKFHAGFVATAHGYTCMLGGGSGLEEIAIELPDDRAS